MTQPLPAHAGCFLLLTPGGEVVDSSPNAAASLGFAPAALQGQPLETLIRPEEWSSWQAALAGRATVPASGNATFSRLRHQHGHWLWCETQLTRAAGGEHWVLHLAPQAEARPDLGMVQNAAIEQGERGILLFDAGSRCLLAANPAGRAYLGREPAAGASVYEILPVDPQRLREALEQPPTTNTIGLGRYGLTAEETGARQAEISLRRVACGGFEFLQVELDDAAARLQLEDELRQARKLEAVGRIAGEVAHDFNNLIAIILGYAELLLQEPGAEERSEAATEIYHAAERASVLTNQLLSFSRRQAQSPQVVDLSQLLTRMRGMLERLAGNAIEVVIESESTLPACHADPGQIEQILLNLAGNARDAMAGRGRLTVAASRPASEPSCVAITVRDTGTGMSESVRARMFEPFFTTKGDGGTGLGLASVQAMVEQNQGTIEVETAPGAGTAIRLFFPAAAHPAAAETVVRTVANKPLAANVLLVEDDDRVRKVMAASLRRAGARVLEAPDGVEAMRVAGGSHTPADLLILDMMLPHMSSRALAAQLRHLWPELRVLPISGYSESGLIHQGLLQRGEPFLQKPFAAASFIAKVEEMLADRCLETRPAATVGGRLRVEA